MRTYTDPPNYFFFVLILLSYELQTWDPLFLCVELYDLEYAFDCTVGKVKTSLQRYFPRNITALFTWDPAVSSMLSSRPSLLTWKLFKSLKFHKRSPILLGWLWKIRLFLQVFPPGTPPRVFRGHQEECFPHGAGQGRTTATAEIPPLFSSPRKKIFSRKGTKTLVW